MWPICKHCGRMCWSGGVSNATSGGDVMDYSKLSDFDINLQVNRALGMKHYPNEDKQIVEVFGDVVIFDPCNNPADAWPIISGNKISTMWMTAEKEWCAWAQGDLEEGTWCWENVPDYYFCCESQLRAAAIVFLMMQEKGKDAGAAK